MNGRRTRNGVTLSMTTDEAKGLEFVLSLRALEGYRIVEPLRQALHEAENGNNCLNPGCDLSVLWRESYGWLHVGFDGTVMYPHLDQTGHVPEGRW